MATKKGPQIYLNDQDPAELEIFKWSETVGKGRKSLATIETIIAGRAIAKVCQPIADLLVSSARRGESLTLEEIEDYITMFKAHSRSEVVEYPTPTKEVAKEETAEPEPDNSKQTGFDSLGG